MSVKLLQLYGPKVFGFFYSLFWVCFFLTRVLSSGRKCSGLFQFFTYKKNQMNTNIFLVRNSSIQQHLQQAVGWLFFFWDSRKAFWVNAGPTSGLTFRNTCQIKSRVQNRAEAVGLETDLDSALLCVVGGVMNRTKKKKKEKPKRNKEEAKTSYVWDLEKKLYTHW